MQIMFDAGCDPTEYQKQGKLFSFPDKTSVLCPHCQADYLRKHGFYIRYLISIGFEGLILIRRYCCPICRKTLSLLPSFCHPKRTYGTLVVFGILEEFYIETLAVCLAVANFHKKTKVECSRQLLRHYRRRIKKNLNHLVMAITDIHALRAPPVMEKLNAKEKVRQFLSKIQNALDDSLKIFGKTRATYLTSHAI